MTHGFVSLGLDFWHSHPPLSASLSASPSHTDTCIQQVSDVYVHIPSRAALSSAARRTQVETTLLASFLKLHVCSCLPSAVIKGVCHHTPLFAVCLYLCVWLTSFDTAASSSSTVLQTTGLHPFLWLNDITFQTVIHWKACGLTPHFHYCD